jgi:hypothetical protein
MLAGFKHVNFVKDILIYSKLNTSMFLRINSRRIFTQLIEISPVTGT